MATNYLENKPFVKRMRPLVLSHFAGIFVLSFLTASVFHFFLQDGVRPLESRMMIYSLLGLLLPFIIFCGPAGVFCDRLPKRGTIIIGKFFQVIFLFLTFVILAHRNSWGYYLMPLIPVMVSLSMTFIYPALRGILPETFQETLLSRANGVLFFTTFVAGTCGVVLAFPRTADFPLYDLMCALSEYLTKAMPSAPVLHPDFLTALFLFIVTVMGLFFSFRIFPTAVNPKNVTYGSRSFWRVFVDGVVSLAQTKEVLLSALGDCFFICFGTFVQLIIIFCVTDSFSGRIALQLSSVAGMAFGCLAAGYASHRKVETGLVPFGALGLAVFMTLAAYCPGLHAADVSTWTILWIFLAGICAGFFVVPLRAYVQKAIKPEALGSAIAVSNAVAFVLFIIINLGGMGLAMHVSPGFLLAGIGICALIATAIAGLIMPALLVRALAFLLTHSLYKLRITGVDSLPKRSPALLVANHSSFVDSLLILACTSRKVRFLVHEKYYRNRYIHPLAVMTDCIEVPAKGFHRMEKMFEEINEGLKNGDLICVYPEGEVSRNGLIGNFTAGYSKMIPEGSNIPLIPVFIGRVWGSMFSYYYGKHIRPRLSLSYHATVSFGKPIQLTEVDTSFRLRQAVEELSAEVAMIPGETEKTLHYQLAKMAKRHPFRKVLCDYKGKRLSLFQALVGAVVLSRKIRKYAGDSQYVGVMLPNTTALAVTLLAVMMADKTPSPLNFTVSKEALRYSINNSGMKLIISNRKFLDKIGMEPIPEMVMIEDIAAEVTKFDKFWWFAMCLLLPHQELMTYVAPETHRDVFSTAVLLFSSGSTGRPKGVMLTHHNINADILPIVDVVGWTINERMLGSLPLFHSFGFSASFWIPVYTGSMVVYVVSPLDATTVCNAIETEKLTIMLATPTFIQAYMRKCRPEQFASLRLAIVGAEKLRKDIAAKFLEITGGHTALLEGYGCTELSPIVSVNVSRDYVDLGKAPGKEGSIGVPMPGICVRIVDPVTRQPLPPDTDGLMLVKSATVMKGYISDPVQTANVISNGWYETGDIARMDSDGYITISGRISRFSKIAGEMVPHELIECVMSEIIGLEERVVAVGGIPDKAKGEALVVLYIPEKMGMTPDEMTAKLREHNIPNLWIPRAANYRAIEKFPTIGTGKLDLVGFQKMVKSEFNV